MTAKQKQILILSDRDFIDTTLLDQLLQQGYVCEIASDDQQALAWLSTQPFDLILLAAPAFPTNRHPFMVQIKADVQLCDLPIIVVAHQDEIDRIEDYLTWGADDYLSLPCRATLLAYRIDRCLEQQLLKQQAQQIQSIDSTEAQYAEWAKMAKDLTQVILPLGIALSAEKDFDLLSERILKEATSLCNADAGTLYLRDENNLRFFIMRTRSLKIALGGTSGKTVLPPPLPLYTPKGGPNHSNVAAYVALTGKPINIPDEYRAEGFDFRGTQDFDRQNGYRTVSCLTVPLKNNENTVIGVLQLLNAQAPNSSQIIPFNSYLCQVVECLSGQAAIALNNQLLLKRQEQLLYGERDLHIGRTIQADFLPETLPQPPGWEIAACFHPARQVAGDFYDAFTLLHNKIGFVIADVCDKGVGAALFMSLFRSFIRILSQQNDVTKGLEDSYRQLYRFQGSEHAASTPEARVLKSTIELTNDYIADNHARSNMFATLFFGVFDPVTGKLSYINGGHEAPIVCGADGIKSFLKPTGPAVGAISKENFLVEETCLEAGDLLFAYTDGLSEARSPDGKFFTHQRLCSILEQYSLSATHLLDLVEASVREHMSDAEPFDDITMIAVRREL